MTVQQLYDWAVENNAEEYEIEIQHRDTGGYYNTSERLEEDNILINGWMSKIIV